MADANKFPLVRRPSSAVEKAAPGAKRILSGMVADTIALVAARVNTEAEDWYKKGISYYEAENYPEAVTWCRKAAEHGFADAQNVLGICYANGEGVAKDEVEAVKWYRKAADQNNVGAQCNLGGCYYHGAGVEQNYVEAVKWCRKAAEHGFADAQYNLGVCYWDGEGVEKDYAEAMKWYRKAAEQGNETAQRRLIIVNHMGCGQPEDQRDIVEAYKWTRVRAGDEEWENLENIKKEMTPEQIQQGETLAREFLSKTAR